MTRTTKYLGSLNVLRTMTSNDIKIAIIVGSTRPGRLGSAVGEWVLENATAHGGAQFDLLEVADFDLSLLGEATVPGAANRQYESAATRAWGQKIDEYDGFVFVTTEYNHGVPAAMKNAVDIIYPEWNDKAVGFVAYGADGGVRAVEQWRQIVANLHLYAVRSQVSLSLFTDFEDGKVKPLDRREGELKLTLDQVVGLAATLQASRQAA